MGVAHHRNIARSRIQKRRKQSKLYRSICLGKIYLYKLSSFCWTSPLMGIGKNSEACGILGSSVQPVISLVDFRFEFLQNYFNLNIFNFIFKNCTLVN